MISILRLFHPGQLAQLLASLGYAPLINPADKTGAEARADKNLLIKLAVAGFAFGNVMLLSFPEYLGLGKEEHGFGPVFGYLNIALSIPVIFFSAKDYFINAWKSFSQRQLNIDVPIALGLAALFLRSCFEIITHTGAGYLDSLTGLVFFLLIGRWFQTKTYETLAFDRDYTSYFPLAVLRKEAEEWKAVVIGELAPLDRIRIRNLEVVPADSELVSEKAFIDYSFVTGETRPVKVMLGDLIYAGGRVLGQPVELIVSKPTSQGHLTSLWNNPVFQKPEERGYAATAKRSTGQHVILHTSCSLPLPRYFGISMIPHGCGSCSLPYSWLPVRVHWPWRLLYFRVLSPRVWPSSSLPEKCRCRRTAGGINTIVFDKTGTVTFTKQPDIRFIGHLSPMELQWIKTITAFPPIR
ncbi:MAG: hypothetical protein WDN75_07940 [Bacteroidota bacterium]